MTLTPNRIAAYLTAASGLSAAIAVPVANLDITSTAGVIGGLAAVLLAFQKWMTGWQAHEARQGGTENADALVEDGHEPADDLTDEELAEAI